MQTYLRRFPSAIFHPHHDAMVFLVVFCFLLPRFTTTGKGVLLLDSMFSYCTTYSRRWLSSFNVSLNAVVSPKRLPYPASTRNSHSLPKVKCSYHPLDNAFCNSGLIDLIDQTDTLLRGMGGRSGKK
ncbi:hypothetical protein DL93DRAFT_2090353 [Clavulina sp. PMI_390]|nr:hypothetical protein DL93DRAFT_2090353 [Clavulina sp. PMI_390]